MLSIIKPFLFPKENLVRGRNKGRGGGGRFPQKNTRHSFLFFILSDEALTKEGLRQSGEIEEGKEAGEITL